MKFWVYLAPLDSAEPRKDTIEPGECGSRFVSRVNNERHLLFSEEQQALASLARDVASDPSSNAAIASGLALFLPGDATPSLRAARAGMEMLANADRRGGELAERYGRAFDINVGLHHGPAIVGALWGNPPTLTAIGDTVNLAARVEQANKDLATRFLTTQETVAELGDAVLLGRSFRRALPGVAGELELVEVLNIS